MKRCWDLCSSSPALVRLWTTRPFWLIQAEAKCSLPCAGADQAQGESSGRRCAVPHHGAAAPAAVLGPHRAALQPIHQPSQQGVFSSRLLASEALQHQQLLCQDLHFRGLVDQTSFWLLLVTT